MAGYLIADNEVTDQSAFSEFAERIVGVMESHGGKWLVRGGPTEVVTGERAPHRVVVVEFESVGAAQACINSAEYQELAAIRDNSSNTTTFIVEGV